MKLGKVTGKYFQSYDSIEFDYADLGLTLISGETKAGKSTLLDLPCWIMFGETSKDSNADDVRSWFADKNKTEGELEIEVNEALITITRIRGSAHDNDLYITKDGEILRGKDSKETQKLIDEMLGVSFDTYVFSSYLHQFSKTDVFFTAKAKERREIFEQVSDLSTAKKLADGASEKRKLEKKNIESIKKELHGFTSQLTVLTEQRKKLSDSWNKWVNDKESKLTDLNKKCDNYEEIRKKEVQDLVSKVELLSKQVMSEEEIKSRSESIKIQLKAFQTIKEDQKRQQKTVNDVERDLSILQSKYKEHADIEGTCPICLNDTSSSAALHDRIKTIESEMLQAAELYDVEFAKLEQLNNALLSEKKVIQSYDEHRSKELTNSKMISDMQLYKNKLEGLRAATNTFKTQIEDLNKQENPYQSSLIETDLNIEQTQNIIEALENRTIVAEQRLALFNWIYDKSFELRSYLLEQARQETQTKTNELLSKYFDGALTIRLFFEDSDKLEFEIQNNGYKSPFKQLSGGERCMLRLCFYLALSEYIQNSKAIKLNCIMIDEGLNGLNSYLKTKAFALLQSLESRYESILVVDHFEDFKELFFNEFHIISDNGVSSVQVSNT